MTTSISSNLLAMDSCFSGEMVMLSENNDILIYSVVILIPPLY